MSESKNKSVRIANISLSPDLSSVINTSSDQSGNTPKRILFVNRKIKGLKNVETPSLGSLEEDFMLETDGNAKNFLKEKNSTTGVYSASNILSGLQYDDNGNIIPYSIVGSPKLFETNKSLVWESFESKLSETDKQRISKHAIFNKKAYNLDPEKEFKEKLKRIKEGSIKEELLKNEKLRKMRPSERIIQERQEKILEAFKNTEYRWKKLEKSLGKKLNKNEGDLLANRAQEYREKVEEWDFLDRTISAKEKAGKFSWYMSLRDKSKEKLDTYLHVGNKFSGLFSRVTERSGEPEPVIRKPGLARTLNKTFRDEPYFQKRIQEESKYNDKGVNFMEAEDLLVLGVAKFPLELEAAKIGGLENVKPSLIEIREHEEIIAENYDENYIRN
ncbi:unnamed protein product [Blepharisma stoltei]|uniref:Uncharacterized protein n=1 Tax=Blepharisma stoltei TaxID=1481888 RepID=A0AAU9JWT5_9CILI|nr:unnamed protein product [Blepharisma stoltei]